ncbi:hypothetical protein N7456_012838 [Penicillium angulare]|uniref:Uncharacterized protein n=1 Tax=Penicillium angulare TaxID=116970 RepID=A0A9W9EKK2_9EURO|nr:hypothetical protein N7456_012838 [Penicillium angulare]
MVQENIAHPAKLVISTEHCEAQSTPGRGCIPSPFIPERERASSIHHYLSEEKETTAVFTESQITTSLAKFISPETQETGKEKLFTNVESKVSDYKSSKTNSNHLLVDELKREPNLRSFDGNPVQDLECMAQAVLDTNGVRQPVDDPAAWPIQTPEIPTSSREFVLANDMPKGLNNKIQRQSSIAAEHVSSTLPNIGSFNVGFGSLSTFMETRGLPDSKHRSKISHSSSNSTHDNEDKEESTLKRPDDFKFVHDANIYSPPIDQSSFINVPSIIEPHFEFNASNLIIFISTDLLKSHIRLVQSLEQRKDSPKCFYRDYSQSQSPQDLNALIPLPQTPINTPQEADLIIAPSVGVILTTSQALSQLYLPGHKSTDPAIRSNLSITSPLKERIFRLTQRHSSSNAASERGRTQLLFQMNKSTQESFDAIQQFCSSISSTMKIFPLLIPAFPETIAEWILALAARHASHILTADYLQNTTLPSIAVRGEEYREWSVNQLIKEDETQWEIWLRSFGLNPYAARAVLDILEAEGDCFTKNSWGERSGPQKETDEISKSAFMRFIQMGPLERLERFKVLLGEHLLFIFQQAIKLGS